MFRRPGVTPIPPREMTPRRPREAARHHLLHQRRVCIVLRRKRHALLVVETCRKYQAGLHSQTRHNEPKTLCRRRHDPRFVRCRHRPSVRSDGGAGVPHGRGSRRDDRHGDGGAPSAASLSSGTWV